MLPAWWGTCAMRRAGSGPTAAPRAYSKYARCDLFTTSRFAAAVQRSAAAVSARLPTLPHHVPLRP
eukprot:4897541-Prymnesium_polylepis.1